MKSMVTFKNVGRLGNYLFEAACAFAYAKKHDLEFTVPTRTKDAKSNPLYLQHLANPDYNPDLPVIDIEERQFNYHELPFSEHWREGHNIVIHGYRQSERYFKEYRDDLLKAFAPEIGNTIYDNSTNKNKEFATVSSSNAEGVVAVHVRRGDYLTIQQVRNGKRMFKHPPVTREWYSGQMSKFRNYEFVFFSDDIQWCKDNFGCYNDCSFSEKGHCANPELADLNHMLRCEHFICSASTFSWWAAWLSQNPKKRVIMPKHWITPGWSNLDFSDVVPSEWERA